MSGTSDQRVLTFQTSNHKIIDLLEIKLEIFGFDNLFFFRKDQFELLSGLDTYFNLLNIINEIPVVISVVDRILPIMAINFYSEFWKIIDEKRTSN